MWAGLGCGGGTEELRQAPPITSQPGGPFPDTLATGIEFPQGTSLTLVAGETATLEVQVTPAGQHTVRFALLGDTEDAFLNASVVETGPDGRAQTSLTVLAPASRFTVRAAASQVSASLDVLTEESSGATLVVTPSYTGRRPVEQWVASVHLDATCASVAGYPFEDGAPTRSGAGEVRLPGIPAEVPLVVVVRAGQFASGCRSVEPLRARSEASVTVEVMDRPMQVGNLSMRVAFGVAPADAPHPALDELVFRAVSRMTAGASDDLAAVLDAMGELAEDPEAFAAARQARSWRAALVAGLPPSLPGSGLRTLARGWMRAGLERLEAPGALSGTLDAVGIEASPTLTLESVIGLEPEQAGFPAASPATAVAEMDDVLRLGTTLEWLPSPMLAQAGTLGAIEAAPERSSASEALAAELGCEDVARLLVEAGDVPDEAFPGCDESCALELCRSAMGLLWGRVADSELPAVPWQLSGAGRAEIDENARPTRVEGSWIGSLTLEGFDPSPAPIQGPFAGDIDD